MLGSFISNPFSALTAVTTFLFARDSAGIEIEYGKGEVYTLRANATILQGEALMHVVPTATLPLSVTPMTAAADMSLFAGVALTGAAAGELVQFVRRGYVIAFTDDSDTPAFGQVLLKPDATTGQFATAAAALAADGQPILGLVLSAEMDGAGVRKAHVLVDPSLGTTNPDTSA